jgi:hypothetical protein
MVSGLTGLAGRYCNEVYERARREEAEQVAELVRRAEVALIHLDAADRPDNQYPGDRAIEYRKDVEALDAALAPWRQP